MPADGKAAEQLAADNSVEFVSPPPGTVLTELSDIRGSDVIETAPAPAGHQGSIDVLGSRPAAKPEAGQAPQPNAGQTRQPSYDPASKQTAGVKSAEADMIRRLAAENAARSGEVYDDFRIPSIEEEKRSDRRTTAILISALVLMVIVVTVGLMWAGALPVPDFVKRFTGRDIEVEEPVDNTSDDLYEIIGTDTAAPETEPDGGEPAPDGETTFLYDVAADDYRLMLEQVPFAESYTLKMTLTNEADGEYLTRLVSIWADGDKFRAEVQSSDVTTVYICDGERVMASEYFPGREPASRIFDNRRTISELVGLPSVDDFLDGSFSGGAVTVEGLWIGLTRTPDDNIFNIQYALCRAPEPGTEPAETTETAKPAETTAAAETDPDPDTAVDPGITTRPADEPDPARIIQTETMSVSARYGLVTSAQTNVNGKIVFRTETTLAAEGISGYLGDTAAMFTITE